MRVGLRSVRMMSGELFVMMDGALQMLGLSADNLVMRQLVGYQYLKVSFLFTNYGDSYLHMS